MGIERSFKTFCRGNQILPIVREVRLDFVNPENRKASTLSVIFSEKFLIEWKCFHIRIFSSKTCTLHYDEKIVLHMSQIMLQFLLTALVSYNYILHLK